MARPCSAGDRLRTEIGRVEILLPDGSALDVDEYTTVDLQSSTLIRVTSGRVLLTVVGASNPAAAVRYQIDTPVASARTDGPGEFRVSLFSAPAGVETEFAVLRGSGSLSTERGTMPVRAGERTLARDNDAPTYPQAFNSARFDAFDRWASGRRDARLGTALSAQYLPSDLRVYGSAFDRYGAWQYDAGYGNVWYPSVGADWRPYNDGYWSSVRPYGWTWIGYDVWTWPTHHYGRWGFARSRWFWIPDRRWSAAWVSWGAAPGYVSWCPLGFDNRPVFALSINVGNPWAGWTVVPRTHFGWYSTRQWAVGGDRLRGSTPFIVQANAPVPPARAIPRAIVDAGGSAGVAVPRSSGVSRRAAATGDSPAPSSAASQSTVINRDSSSARGPVAIPRDRRTPQPDTGATPGNPRFSAGGDSRLSVGDSRVTPGDRRPPAPDRSFQTPGGGTVTVDRSLSPAERRQQSDQWLKQPLPDAPRAYQRNPAGVLAAPPASGQDTRPSQTSSPGAGSSPAAPRWQTYSGTRMPPRYETPASQPTPSSGTPESTPRWQPYSGVRGPARAESAPSQRQASPPPATAPPASAPPPSYRAPAPPPPASAPAPSYRTPAYAAPRSEPPPSSAPPPSSGGESSGRGARSDDGSRSGGAAGSSGAGGGARQRHP